MCTGAEWGCGGGGVKHRCACHACPARARCTVALTAPWLPPITLASAPALTFTPTLSATLILLPGSHLNPHRQPQRLLSHPHPPHPPCQSVQAGRRGAAGAFSPRHGIRPGRRHDGPAGGKCNQTRQRRQRCAHAAGRRSGRWHPAAFDGRVRVPLEGDLGRRRGGLAYCRHADPRQRAA